MRKDENEQKKKNKLEHIGYGKSYNEFMYIYGKWDQTLHLRQVLQQLLAQGKVGK